MFEDLGYARHETNDVIEYQSNDDCKVFSFDLTSQKVDVYVDNGYITHNYWSKVSLSTEEALAIASEIAKLGWRWEDV